MSTSTNTDRPPAFVVNLEPPDPSTAAQRHIADMVKKGFISVSEASKRWAEETVTVEERTPSQAPSFESAEDPGAVQHSQPLSRLGSYIGMGIDGIRGASTTSSTRRTGPTPAAVPRGHPAAIIAHATVEDPWRMSQRPINRGTYVSTQHRGLYNEHAAAPSSWKRQYYTASMSVDQEIPPRLNRDLSSSSRLHDVFTFLFDTGSSNTWARSAYCRRLIKPWNSSRRDELYDDSDQLPLGPDIVVQPYNQIICDWPSSVPQLETDPRPEIWSLHLNRGLVNDRFHDARKSKSRDGLDVLTLSRENAEYAGEALYAAGPTALLTLQSKTDQCFFMDAYDWGTRSWDNGGPRFTFRFAAAYAVAVGFATFQCHGILGLSPEKPSQSVEGGIILFFHLVLQQRKSWAAFNTWPCAKIPNWSPDIAVFPFPGPNGELGWNVRVVEVRIIKPDEGLWGLRRYSIMSKYSTSFDVLLDTGTSISYLPHRLINALQAGMFGHTIRKVSEADSNASRPLFTVGPNQDMRTGLRLEFVFKGRYEGSRNVTVTVPFDPFVYTLSPNRIVPGRTPSNTTGERECLLWPTGAPSSTESVSLNILGLVCRSEWQ
ncbi:uncharacterized protein TRAVEDRAFT_21435 [Trametes versicolor FP-101664 SS1]|uniref:uncharacterized protein n=1 Tax=Trametes versicolor (strain FP-101664) TaxID=717944 RepID=UPI0004622E2D|nr:uncharacterized protein TRAVEDRAFT_21435 [Trametes versicolor FP-101664 SS1]EIW58002.1 hypothetical protein TRAVEDRAFT_21435 [Trametes versicolor FP-101664 SS1]